MNKPYEAAPLIRVLIVDDSPVLREFLSHILRQDPALEVVGTAADGEEALEAVRRLRPDVITMDLHMARMNGVEATRRIMETCPTPIVVVSGSDDPGEVATTFGAIEAGALASLSRPPALGHPEHADRARELTQTVRLMAEVKVVRRWPKTRAPAPIPPPAPRRGRGRVIAIGASTGGPPALHTIVRALPKSLPVPVLIVQHMAPGFIQGFADWLAQASPLAVRLAADGERLLPGHVYIAPDDAQMKVARGGRIVLAPDEAENGVRPSVSCLFRSVAEVYGGEAIAALLTGMGRDGASELLLLKEKGAITIAQDRQSSVVHGMPGEAIRLGAATLVLPPEKIAPALVGAVNQERDTEGPR